MKNKKKILLISGSSKGLGKDLVKYFIKRNYIVFGCGRNKLNLNSKKYNHTVLDVNNEVEVRQWIEKVYNKYKKIDYLINNIAMIPTPYPAILNNKDLVLKVFKTNVVSQINLINEVSKKMVNKKFGRIVSFSSMAAGLLEEGTSLYSSSKNSIVTYTKIVAKELANANVSCNIVAPSMYNTKSFKKLGHKVIENSKKKLQIKRELKLEEITNVIEFLFKKESGVVTGQTIYLGLTV